MQCKILWSLFLLPLGYYLQKSCCFFWIPRMQDRDTIAYSNCCQHPPYAVSYGIPIMHSRNPKETAAFLQIIAKREQEEKGKDFTLHAEKREMDLKGWQEYIVAAFPG